MTEVIATEIRVRRGTAAEWVYSNEVLNLGEPGYETDTGLFKIGDGTTAWTGLRYAGFMPAVEVVDTQGDPTVDRPNAAPLAVWVAAERPDHFDPLHDLWPSGIAYTDAVIALIAGEATARDAAIAAYTATAIAAALAAYSNTTATKALINNAINAYDAGLPSINDALNALAVAAGMSLVLDNGDGTLTALGADLTDNSDGTITVPVEVALTANNDGTITYPSVAGGGGGTGTLDVVDNDDGTLTLSLV
jgi:hypothetical protein